MTKTPFHLHGKTVLVTGASGGIGAQVAISIAEMGGTVIITGRNEDRLKETLAKLKGDGHRLFVCDLTDETQIKSLAGFVSPLDGVVHCAGIVSPFPVKYLNRDKVNETFNINFTSAVLLMSALFSGRKIKSLASVVFISSFAGTYPYRGGAMYAASKAALEKYSVVLSSEHASSGIRSNCISPALIETRIMEDAFTGDRSEYRELAEERHLLGFGAAEDVANLAVFLLAPASRWLTGQNIILDGGYLLGLISKMSNK